MSSTQTKQKMALGVEEEENKIMVWVKGTQRPMTELTRGRPGKENGSETQYDLLASLLVQALHPTQA